MADETEGGLMNSLIRFLQDRLADDERIARAVQDSSAPWDCQWKPDGDRAVRTHNDWVLAHCHDGHELPSGFAAHVARHDPARVLADVAAKQQIVDLCEWVNQEDIREFSDLNLGRAQQAVDTLRLLALPYAAHPSYREDWKP